MYDEIEIRPITVDVESTQHSKFISNSQPAAATSLSADTEPGFILCSNLFIKYASVFFA